MRKQTNKKNSKLEKNLICRNESLATSSTGRTAIMKIAHLQWRKLKKRTWKEGECDSSQKPTWIQSMGQMKGDKHRSWHRWEALLGQVGNVQVEVGK